MNVALLGFDVDGRASYAYYTAMGDIVTICDQNEQLVVPEGAQTQLGQDYLKDLDRFDVLVRTSGMPPGKILEQNPDVAGKVTTQLNEFFAISPTTNIIGVTGTKGKGTTSTLIAKMLEASGKSVALGGNIGVPPFTFLPELDADSWVVLELSSFQLSDLRHSPHIAVCLMVVPEHLNWHADMDDYTLAKSNLFAHQTSDDIAIYFADNPLSQEIAEAGAGRKLPYYRSPGAWVNGNMITIAGQEVCTTDELKLLGRHNWQNVCAAITAVWQVTQNIAAIRSVLLSFTGLEHRLEFVREINGVKYYDDSFGTTPETAIVALEAFARPKIAILGGSDKGVPFDGLAEAVVKNNVRKAVIIGQTGPAIVAELAKRGFTDVVDGGPTMQTIIAAANDAALPGDVVLLSTGCASFGMFRDYKDRGIQFKVVVSALA
jgi:UDP-N-acetylmuramoylalanine--D-glutamate ligase